MNTGPAAEAKAYIEYHHADDNDVERDDLILGDRIQEAPLIAL